MARFSTRHPSSTTVSGWRVRRGQRLKEIQAARDEGVARHTAPMNPFYITTPIYYINAQPHIGHAYTTMVADAIARSRRLLGDDVFFLTGTDEHGQKVERAAQKAGLKTEVFAEQMAASFRQMCGDLNISNDDFIRTTEPRHHRASQELWRRVAANGDIYKGDYEGWYCTVDEIFVPETQLVDGKCPTCGNKVERLKEESYYFRLSKYQQPLLDFYDAESRLSAARLPPERNPRVRRSRPPGPEHQPHVVPVGHSGSGRSEARHVRVVRCADQLPDGARIRNGRRRAGRIEYWPVSPIWSARKSSGSTRCTGPRS